MCNTAIEFGTDAGDILASARSNIERMAAGFRRALRRARERGEARADLDPDATADLFVGTFHGVAVMARSKSLHTRIEHSIRIALRELD